MWKMMERSLRKRVEPAGFYLPVFPGPENWSAPGIIQVRPDINRGKITINFELSKRVHGVGRINSQQNHDVGAFPGGILSHVRHGIVSVMPGQVIVK